MFQEDLTQIDKVIEKVDLDDVDGSFSGTWMIRKSLPSETNKIMSIFFKFKVSRILNLNL